MHTTVPPIPGLNNSTREYSPITLCREWSTLGRLVFVVVCTTVGSIMNGFFVASFFIEHSLKRIGYVFQTCMGLADMIVTSAVLPLAGVVLLSGQWDTAPVCHILQFLTEAATYIYSMFFTLVAAETYFRVCHTQAEYDYFMSLRIGLVSIMVFVIGFIVAAIGTYFDLDYDYCQRLHFGNHTFRIVTSVIFQVIPFILTSYCLLRSSIRIRQRSAHLHYKRTMHYERDYSLIHLNMSAYIFYVLSWTPYIIVVHEFPGTSDSKYYHCAWIGVGRSLLTAFLYSCLNRSFRCAFAQLFYYCCCKSTMTGSLSNRQRRALEYRPATGDVRVHIMHQAVTSGSPQRGASASREQEL